MKRSQSGAQSSSSSAKIVERMRGSASTRHMSASSAFISVPALQASASDVCSVGVLT